MVIRRIIVGIVALVLAIGGGLATFAYASSADARAIAELAPQRVFVVAEQVPAGTAAEDLAPYLEVRELPTNAVLPGGVTDLADVEGLLTTTDLLEGEQLLAARFQEPTAVAERAEVPPGMHQISIELEPRRVVGGDVRVGDTVGIFVSGTVADATGTVDQSHLILHKVLVTDIRGASGVVLDEQGNAIEEDADDRILVTLALSAPDAERVVFASEFGSIWLSLEAPDVPEEGTRIVTPLEVFE